MSELEFNSNTLTDAQCQAIIEAWKYCFPEMKDDCKEPFVMRRAFIKNQEKHNAFFIFGNFIYYDSKRKGFIIRRIADGCDLEDIETVEDSIHLDIFGVIERVILRHARFRLEMYCENEYDDDGKEIPFSSRYECAVHGRKYKAYDSD